MVGLGGIIVNIMAQKLDFSMGENLKQDMSILKQAITGCAEIRKTDETIDKTGIDYIATLRGGAIINIDAKRREKGCSRYWQNGQPEIALEIYSVIPCETNKGKTGWTLNEKSDVDLILYTFDKGDCDSSYLIPFQHLRLAFIRNYTDWAKRFGVKTQKSDCWKSSAIFAPVDDVLDAIRQISVITA